MSRRGAMLLLRVSPHDTESCHAAKRPACPGRSSCREQISEPERTTKSRQSSAEIPSKLPNRCEQHRDDEIVLFRTLTPLESVDPSGK